MYLNTEELSPQRILFLRVGIDTGCGGALAPLFPDGSFEYVPIFEAAVDAGTRSVRFHDIPARSGGSVARFVPKRFRDGFAHHDPDLDSYTYGDPGRNKRAQLVRLQAGDLLVFFAGLTPAGFRGHDALYVIGYFAVRAVHQIPEGPQWPPEGFGMLSENAHLRRSRPDPGLVIIEGDHARSRLPQRAALLSDDARNVLADLVRIRGFGGSVKRAVGRWVPDGNLAGVSEWLRSHE